MMIDGYEFNVERRPTRRASRAWRPMLKVRHVPKSYMSIWVADAMAEDAIVGLEMTISEASRRADVEWPARCHAYLSKQTRRVRMARKRRRGWA